MKKVCFPTVCEKCENYVIKHDNTPVAHTSFKTLLFDGDNKVCKKMRIFYQKLFCSFKKWTQTDFSDYVLADYDSDKNARKKYRYAPFYLDFFMQHSIIDKTYVEVKLFIRLKKKNKILSEKNVIHLWDIKNGALLKNAYKKSKALAE